MTESWKRVLLKHSNGLPPSVSAAVSEGNDEKLLDILAGTILDAKYTDIIVATCSKILAHICLTLPQHGGVPAVLATFGRIIPQAPYLSRAAVQYLQQSEVDLPSLPADDAISYLLGLLRLVTHNAQVFTTFIKPAQLSHLLGEPNRAVRYLSIRILQLYLQGADHWFERMIQQYLGSDSADTAILGLWDDRSIDYRFLNLWEETRSNKCVELTNSIKVADAEADLPIQLFHPQTTLVGGQLLLKDSSVSMGSPAPPVSLVQSTNSNLTRLALALRGTQPVLLVGPAGSGKTLAIRHAAFKLGKSDRMVTLHLNDQSDAKLLAGVYTSGEKPGSIIWKAGVLTTAVREGRWVVIDDIDRAPDHIVGALLELIEHGTLTITSRKQTLHAAPGFRLIATTQAVSSKASNKSLVNMLGRRHWHEVEIQPPSDDELHTIINERYPAVQRLSAQIIATYQRLLTLKTNLGKTSTARQYGLRDLLKWCSRISQLLAARNNFASGDIDDIFLEAVDCFVGALPDGPVRDQVISLAAEELHIDPQRRDFLLADRQIRYNAEKQHLSIGRYVLTRQSTANKIKQDNSFSVNPYTLRNMEKIAAAVISREPLLLVGETGVGKTTSVQYLAAHLGKKLVPFNLSQQSEAGDLLGGFKPVNLRMIVVAMQDEFETLFTVTFSHARNQQFIEQLTKYMARGNWKAVCKLWRQALKMVDDQKSKLDREGEAPSKKRKVAAHDILKSGRWEEFAAKVTDLEARLTAGSEKFAFSFVEGNIVTALRNGDWILLDEINLASSDTLEALADLLDADTPSVLLTEAGSTERIKAHPEFRVFAAMNPATDVGKKDLPPGVRSRFTELYIESPDKDLKSLQAIVSAYLRQEVVADPAIALDVSKLYQSIIALAAENKLVDGAAQRPHFSLRTLTRTLSYAKHIAPQCNLRRALYEGFQMSFMTFLEVESAKLVTPLLEKHLFRKKKEWKNELRRPLQPPQGSGRSILAHPSSKHWVKQGRLELQEEQRYIITPFIERNLENLARAASTRKFPVLIQGPTSSGKTSMIEYLAKRTGHKFVRINNHEHTDLQEYLGTYVSTPDGRLQFQEGLLVRALREGHWIVLDELNLAPTDVLEALNRLLDDNRELLIPETQETVRPHEDFMLFATQNPAGLYGGRKALSRAFRNRFLELHFDDIPIDELQEILQKRNPQLPESRCRLVVAVYQELAVMRQQNRLFEQKSFATLRDLFRWAMRTNDTIEQLAENGFMLLGERVRKPEERQMIKETIEKVMSKGRPRVIIDENKLYPSDSADIQLCIRNCSVKDVVWTKAMRRLYTLVTRAAVNKEPVLLVGDTGCGKTTVCQMLADALDKPLHVVNAHQNTETGDLIGSQRPIRNRAGIEAELRSQISASGLLSDTDIQTPTSLLIESYKNAVLALSVAEREQLLASPSHQAIQNSLTRFQALFEWVDGSLIEAMKEGSFFLLDEISLADDSVLERLNSVLESSRSILLAEKGSLDSAVTAQDDFRFLATMNPGGDYGKRELSPALRNRFTEIWVPSITDHEDIIAIIQDGLHEAKARYANTMLEFAQWFKVNFDASTTSGLSIREVLAWKTFLDAAPPEMAENAVIQGAAMVYIDTIGANPAGLMAASHLSIPDARNNCLEKLASCMQRDVPTMYRNTMEHIEIKHDAESLQILPYTIRIRDHSKLSADGFNFAARTTRINAFRVARAMQLAKPILLEGKPGVGKTALITALACNVGVSLTRINLSEQTDLIDLFGADAPVEGSEAGTFAWRDAPFLRAMKNGEWVLLDEMNLASQSILEGLNAVLDHRGKAFIPELGLSFDKHPDFKLFAAQNPHHQGGGRKGLPASFVNRFTVVYADSFDEQDLCKLSAQAFPGLQEDFVRGVVAFVQQLDAAVSEKKLFGISGSPWEFNFRDVSKWLQLQSTAHPLCGAASSVDLAKLLFELRFRNEGDRARVRAIFENVFQAPVAESDLACTVSTTAVQLGLGVLPRRTLDTFTPCTPLPPDQTFDADVLQALMVCVQNSWPTLLSGPSGAGKTTLVERLAGVLGAEVRYTSLNAETDAMDLIGGYEQVDVQSSVLAQLGAFDRELQTLVKKDAAESAPTRQLESVHVWREIIHKYRDGSVEVMALLDQLQGLTLPGLHQLISSIKSAAKAAGQVHFTWVDGVLVDAVQQGTWLVLENANLCSPSVLDRLNSLLESNGTLILSEHVEQDGAPKVLLPHPNFRIFLTTDPKYGELSRAMRNRTVELFVAPSAKKVSNLMLPLPDSSMHRFRLAGVSLTLNTSAGLDDMMGRLSFRDQELIRRFSQQLEAGLFGHADTQDAIQHVSTLPREHLQHTSQLVDQAVSRRQLPTDFAYAQTIHPLHNQPLFEQDPDLRARALYLGVAYDILVALSALSDSVDAQRGQRSQVSRLQRMERRLLTSSTIARGTSAILDLLNATGQAFQQTLIDSDSKDSDELVRMASRAMVIIGAARRLLDNGSDSELDECVLGSSLNFCLNLIRSSWLAEPLTTALSSVQLITDDAWGAQCVPLWRLLKPRTVRTPQQFDRLAQLHTLISKFDILSFDFEKPLAELAELRTGLLRMLEVVKSSEDVDLTNISGSIETILPKTDVASGIAKLQPHFIEVFQELVKQLTIRRTSTRTTNVSLEQSLSLLACVGTTLGSAQYVQHNVVALPAMDMLWETDAMLPLEQTTESPDSDVFTESSTVSIRVMDLLACEISALGEAMFKQSETWTMSEHQCLERPLRQLLQALLPDLSVDAEQMSIVQPSAISTSLTKALAYLNKTEYSTQGAARAWFAIGIHGLKQYVPGRIFDPAADVLLERQVYQSAKNRSQEQIEALLKLNSVVTGRASSLHIRVRQAIDARLPDVPADPQVYRPVTSQVPALYAILDSLRRLVIVIDSDGHTGLDGSVWANLKHIRSRLAADFTAYMDFVGPIICFLDCLIIGQHLLSTSNDGPGHPQLWISALVPFRGATLSGWDNDASFCQPVRADPQHRLRLSWLTLVSARSSLHRADSASHDLRNCIEEQFGRLYEAWKRELAVDQRQHAAKSSLYKYQGADESGDQEALDGIEELFPTYSYDKVDDEDEKPLHTEQQRSRTQDIAPQLARVHRRLFGNPSTVATHVPALLQTCDSPQLSRITEQSELPTVLVKLAQLKKTLLSPDQSNAAKSYYTSANIGELHKLRGLLVRILQRFEQLHDVWPEHALPIEVFNISNDVKSLPFASPLPRLMPWVEKLYGTMVQWQSIASTEYSVTSLVDATADLIVSWRRIELQSWTTLLTAEEEGCRDSAASWWFTAYETIIIGGLSLDPNSLNQHLPELIDAVKGFLEGCGLGEFSTRLTLLKTFIKHVDAMYRGNPVMEAISTALSNLTSYFEKYRSSVELRLKERRDKLGKDMNDLVRLASWKDRNIESLRQSAAASHRKLFRLVRKYRIALAEPVQTVIIGGLPGFVTSGKEQHKLPLMLEAQSPAALTQDLDQLQSWHLRSKRYQNIGITAVMLKQRLAAFLSQHDTHERLESFMDDLKRSMNELRKATPSTRTEKTETVLGHLKNRKRRLLADVLRELRIMGLQHNLSQDVLAKQRSMAIVFAGLPRLDALQDQSTQSAATDHLQRLLTLMPAVREGARKHSEDLTPAEAARCTMLLESMLDKIMAQQRRLYEVKTSFIHLETSMQQLNALAVDRPLLGGNVIAQRLLPLYRCQAQIMSSCLSMLDMHQSLTGTNLSKICEELNNVQVKIQHCSASTASQLPDGLQSEQDQSRIAELRQHNISLRAWMTETASTYPEIRYLLKQLELWLCTEDQPTTPVNDSEQDSETWTSAFLKLADELLLAAEQQPKSRDEPTDETAWLQKAQVSLDATWATLRVSMVATRLSNLLAQLHTLKDADTMLTSLSAMCSKVLPLFKTYQYYVGDTVDAYLSLNAETGRLGHTLASAFITLAKDGFCEPPKKDNDQQQDSGNVESGTGLGDGEGAEDISKDIKDDEDLSELAQGASEDKEDQENIADEKDAVDMADEELEGKTQDVENGSDDEEGDDGEEQDADDMDEEVGSVNDDTAGALDEKMWDDGKVEEEQDKEASNSKGTKDEELAAAEDGKVNEDAQGEDEQGDQNDEEPATSDNGDNVERPEIEGTDPHVQEQETLDLPDDINVDGESVADEDMTMSDAEMDDLSDVDHGEEKHEADDMPGDISDTEEADGEQTEEAGEQAEPEESLPEDDGLLQDNTATEDQKDDPIEGVVAGEQGTGRDQDEEQMQLDTGAADAENDNTDGTAQTDPSDAAGQGEDNAPRTNDTRQAAQEAAPDEATNQLKQLGDALQKFFRQNAPIEAAKESEEGKDAPTKDDSDPTSFEHLADENDKSDAQAIGTGSMDDSKALPENEGIPVDDQKTAEDVPMTETMDEEEDEFEDASEQQQQAAEAQVEVPQGPQAFIGTQRGQEGDVEMQEADEEDVEVVNTVDLQLSKTHISEDGGPMDFAEARQLWSKHESNTRTLALILTEHLRLILQPTQATKMRGDFRTGKRLNIKKIIPYIASSYKRDKIWMRRTTPTKRNYQIMLAIDDSKSMAENDGKELAFATLAMVTRSLSMLEVGELCVLSFGEESTVAHDFSIPFTPDAGPEIFRTFTFDQSKTNVRRMIAKSIDLFREARLRATGAASELWQLQLIISDGQCEDHAGIRQLVRQAQEERIMIVFIVVDAGYEGDDQQTRKSILDLPSAEFVKDENGEMQLKMTQYFDTFPFKYYLIVRDVTELPGVLAGALRQWFAEVVETGSG